MAIYYMLFSILSFFSLIERNNEYSKKILKIIVLILILFVGLRYQVGNDYAEYYLHHSLIHQGVSNYFEPLFVLLNYVLPTPYQMFFVSSAISFIFLYLAFRYFLPNHGILLFTLYYGLYLVIFNIHIVRQGIAIAIVIYAWKYAFEQKKGKFVSLVLIASGFHTSAIISLPVYLIRKIIISKQLKVVLLSLSIIIFVVLNYFKNFVFNIISLIPMLERYAEVYIDPEFASADPISFGFILNLIAYFFVEFIIVSRPEEFNTQKMRFIETVFFISTLASIILRFSSIVLRLNYYYQVSNIFIFAMIIFFFKESNLAKIFFIIIALLYLYVNLTTGNAVVEYKTVFLK